MKSIIVRGAQEHNLKDVSVDIPKNAIVAFTGVSGSGKSSLVFDTIYIEAFRRFADASAAPVYLMGNSMWAKASRPKYKAIQGLPPALGLSQRQGVASKLSTVGTISGLSDLFRVYFAAFGDVFCRACNIPLRATPFLGLLEKIQQEFEGMKIVVIAPIAERRKGAFEKEIEKFRQLGFAKVRVNGASYDLQDDEVQIKIDAKKLNTVEVLIDKIAVKSDKKARLERALSQAIQYGKGVATLETDAGVTHKYNTKASCPQCGESAPNLDPRYFSHSSQGQCHSCGGTGAKENELPADLFPCTVCNGSRLSPARPVVRVHNETFEKLHLLCLTNVCEFVSSVLMPEAAQDKAKRHVVYEADRMLRMVLNLGLGHLSLNRAGASLSPGDLQRLRLASMLSNRLSGALYVLDEPCQGLTSAEVVGLVQVLRQVKEHGGSVLVVEHHPEFLRHCDKVFVMGPGAGAHGGTITEETNGTKFFKEHANEEEQQTINLSAYAKERGFVRIPSKKSLKVEAKKTKKGKADVQVAPEIPQPNSDSRAEFVRFKNLKLRTLNKHEVTLRQQAITILRGPSGTGKATFLELFATEALEAFSRGEASSFDFLDYDATPGLKVTHVNSVKPGSLTRSSRRSVASALEVVDPLRGIFADLPSSKVMGLGPSHFSWHSKLGRCDHCDGKGYIELQQRYGGPAVQLECEICLGARLSSRSLIPRYKGLNFSELMNLSIEEVAEVFAPVPSIHGKLERAAQFGLGYVGLGQNMDSLSGGELQRLNLTMELKRAQLAGSWFILVHPGTGLHAPDIRILGELMQLMVNRGATFVVLENREEFLKYGNHVIEF